MNEWKWICYFLVTKCKENHVLLVRYLKSFKNIFEKCHPFFSQLDGSSKRRRTNLKQVMDIDCDKNYLKDDSTAHKCNQCEYISSRASNLKAHLKTHSGEKSNKCNQCDYASSQAGHWGHIWRHTVEKSQTSATNVIMHPITQAI